jgi:ferredoxin
MTKYLNIDTDECKGCGTCAEMCSSAFALDEITMKAKVLDPASAGEDEIEEVILSCPAQCISWRYRDCGDCETCMLYCSNVFAFNESEEMAELILPDGSLEDCLEDAMEGCADDCIDWDDF